MPRHKFHQFFYRLFISALIFICALAPTLSLYAIDYKTLRFFADNNIIYFDPTPRRNCSSALDCNIAGNTRDEKLWSGLRNLGFTPEQTAALMGNILHEGGSPTRQEDAYNIARNRGCESSAGPYTIWDDETNGQRHTGCMQSIYSGYRAGSGVAGVGLGFVGWTAHNLRLGYLELMQDAGLIKYFEGDAYKTYGQVEDDQLKELIISETGSEADYWALWCTALRYIYSQLTTPQNGADFTKFFDIEGVENIAGYFAEHYEVCNGCNPGQSSYNARIATANEVYSRYKNGEFSAVESATANGRNYNAGTLTDGSNVTIVGDSITVGSEAKILELMPKAEIVSQVSKRFAGTPDSSNPTGQQIVESMQTDGGLRSTVVIALGTNNYSPPVTTPEIDTMISSIGDGHNIIFVNNYDDLHPERYNTNNELFEAAAVKYDNVSIADWRSAVEAAKKEHPGTSYIVNESTYAVHPTAEGQALFAQIIAEAVAGRSSALDNCPSDGTISDPSQAISYLQQFIVDTNAQYGTKYPLPPADLPLNVAAETPADDSPVGGGSCWGATYCGQCTALSGWFIQMMTDLTLGATGHGSQTVSLIAQSNSGRASILYAAQGQYPQGIAVFSMQGGPWGHTGIVMGKDEASGDYITIENNQPNAAGQAHRLEIMTRSAETFRSRSTSFYPIEHVKTEHLGTNYQGERK